MTFLKIYKLFAQKKIRIKEKLLKNYLIQLLRKTDNLAKKAHLSKNPKYQKNSFPFVKEEYLKISFKKVADRDPKPHFWLPNHVDTPDISFTQDTNNSTLQHTKSQCHRQKHERKNPSRLVKKFSFEKDFSYGKKITEFEWSFTTNVSNIMMS